MYSQKHIGTGAIKYVGTGTATLNDGLKALEKDKEKIVKE